MPPLVTLTLSLTRDPLIPLGAGNGLVVGWEGRTLELEAPDAPGLVRGAGRLAERADPDLVLSDWGDEEIIPTLRAGAGSMGRTCPWTGKQTRPPGGSETAAAIFLTAASSTRDRRPPLPAAGTWTGATPSTTGNRGSWA